MGEIWAIYKTDVRRQLENPRFYAALLLIPVFMAAGLRELPLTLHKYGMQVQACELFPFVTSDRIMQILLLISVLLLTGDAPFLHSGMETTVIRTDKEKWLKAQILFLFHTVIVGMAVLEGSLILVSMGQIRFDNAWSDYMILLSRLQTGGRNMGLEIGISMLPISEGTPYVYFMIAYLYAVLLYGCMGMWGLVCNLLTGRNYGALLVMVFAAERFLLFNLTRSKLLEMMSPFNLVDLTYHGIQLPEFLYTAAFFGIQILGLYLAAEKILRKRDMCNLR